MNDTIKSMIEAREAKKAELIERSKKSEDVNELRSINSEIDDINGQIAELRSLAQQEEKAAEERKAADDKVKAEKEAEARTAAVDTAKIAENIADGLRSAKFVQGKGFDFHFPLVREMQLYGKKATKHAEGQSFLREPRFSRPASRNFPWASSMFGAGSRKQEQQKSRAFSRFPISPEQYDKHQEYTERKHHDTSFRE